MRGTNSKTGSSSMFTVDNARNVVGYQHGISSDVLLALFFSSQKEFCFNFI